MLIFDQLKKNDPHLRWLAIGVAGGMLVLLGGLWWMQVVSARDYRANLETQSFRTVRIPPVRGRILDRNGYALAENKPTYNINLYLEHVRKQSTEEFNRIRPVKVVTNSLPFWKHWLGMSGVRTQYARLSSSNRGALEWQAHWTVVSNAIRQVSRRLEVPFDFDAKQFKRHYDVRRSLPYPVAKNITPVQVARFEECATNPAGMDLEVETTRVYNYQQTAAHLIGCLRLDDRSMEGEESYYSYPLPYYSGILGIEKAYDKELHGRSGGKSVMVNNFGFRQRENIWTPAEPGSNVVLTIDLRIQQATERALAQAPVPSPRGAAVVMDVRTGDVLAMASVPAFDPNYFVDRRSFPPEYYDRIRAAGAERNRATQDNYHPGSIIKPLIGLACLESGLDPNAKYEVQRHPTIPNKGAIYVRRRLIKDEAPPGLYNFKEALIHSSNAYFITNGIHVAGLAKIVQLARQLHLGESFRLGTWQETPGHFPTEKRIRAGWSDGDTANLCIGQGLIDVTPLQMAVMAAAFANGGIVLEPRLVDRVESQDPILGGPPDVKPRGVVRDRLSVRPRSLQIIKDAMVADVEESGGTGSRAFIPGFRICGKTGTAEVEDERGKKIDQTTWFLSFAPYENPRYAVVVMIESGVSGGVTCAPVAKEIYLAILESERSRTAKPAPVARRN